jgi:hypothetical protein
MTAATEYLVYVTDPDLTPVGQPIDTWTALDLVLKVNDVDSVSVTAPGSPELADLTAPGRRLEVLRKLDGEDWQYLTGGPIEAPGDKDWSQDGSSAPPGVVVIQSADDRARLAGRLTYPTPANDSEHQTVTDKRTFTAANSEVAMRALVNENAGPGALTNRRVPQLVLGTLEGIGGPVTYSSRMGLLTDDLRAIGLAGGGLIYEIIRTPAPSPELQFHVREPVDRSGMVVYSDDLGNLRTFSIKIKAPIFTVAIVGGGGEGTARVMVEVVNADALAAGWERVESFVDGGDTTDIDELTAAGVQALTEAAGVGSITVTAVDDAKQRFGRDYYGGDVVGVVIDGVMITAPVTSVTISVRTDGSDAGEVVSPQIGGQPITDSATLRKLRDLEKRLGNQEKRR